MTCKVARKKKKHCDLLADFKWKIPKEFRVTARPLLVTDASPTDNAYILSPAWRAVSENRLPTRRTPSINTGQKTPSSSNSPRGAGRHRTARSGARGRAQVAVRGQTGQLRSAQGQPRAPGRPSAPRPLTARRPARRALPRGVAPSPPPPPPPGRPAAGTKPRPPAPHRTAPPRAPAAPETMVTGRSGAAARGNGTAATRGGEGRGNPAAAPVNLSPAARPRPPRLAPRPAPRHLPPAAGGGCGSPAPGSAPRRRLCRRGQGAAATSRASPGRRPAPGTRAVPCPARPCPAAGTASRAAPQRAGRAGGAGPGGEGRGRAGRLRPRPAAPPAEGGVGRRGRACPRGGHGRRGQVCGSGRLRGARYRWPRCEGISCLFLGFF